MSSASLIEKCCLIACPVAGNPTHYIVEHALAHQGLDWRFMTFEVAPERLADAIRGVRALGFHGVKIGEPFHEAVIEHLDELTERARKCGSVNCVSADGERLVGDNTEGAALVELVRPHVRLAGKKAMILGAGRLARAIGLALADEGAAAIVVANRSPDAGRRLVELIGQESAATATLVSLGPEPVAVEPDVALVVNATSLESNDPNASLPLDAGSFPPSLVMADVDFHTTHTGLARQAAERGCTVIDGVQLFVEQTALALRTWTGSEPDIATMREAAEEFLGI